MQEIWAPWRMGYIESAKPDGCLLCQKPAEGNDAAAFILYRGRFNYVMLNAYPYNPGHLMIIPYRHIPALDELKPEERNEHFDIVSRAVTVLRDAVSPQGFNIGINLGAIAGAGIDDHIHTHVVPRWQGDTNFMPVLADVRVLPEALAATYAKLEGRFPA